MTIADDTIDVRSQGAERARPSRETGGGVVLEVKDSSSGCRDQDRAADFDGPDQSADDGGPTASARRMGTVRSWPLLLLAMPAAVAVWSGWVGIGQMTGFGQVHPLPGIWGSLHLNTAAYALRAWLSASSMVSDRTRRFARWSAIGSLLLGMGGQVAYHLLALDRVTHAPWGVTTAVSCLPVLVLGMGAALAHILRGDANLLSQHGQDASTTRCGSAGPDRSADTLPRHRIAEAKAAAQHLIAAGERVSRRSLRRAAWVQRGFGCASAHGQTTATALTMADARPVRARRLTRQHAADQTTDDNAQQVAASLAALTGPPPIQR
jgi:hypothetical protein